MPHHQLHAGGGHGFIAKGNHFGIIMAGVDMQQHKRQLERPAGNLKSFDGQREQHHRIFAAGKQKRRLFGFGNHFADDVDGFGFQPVEMAVLDRHRLGSLFKHGVYFSEAV